MDKFRFTIKALAIAIVMFAFVSITQAQASRTWVSGVGDDANPCSRTAPCKTFAGTISKTATGGYINCLDPAGFGAVTIIKSITIQCEEETGHIVTQGTSAIIVNTPANSVVTLRGLSLEGFLQNGSSAGLHGINFIGAGTLQVQEVVIHDFSQNGINFAPSSGIATLHVTDETVITNNNAGNTAFAGIMIKPSGGAAVNADINGVQVESNANGIQADGTGGGGAINVNVRDCKIASNTNTGIVATTNGPAIAMTVNNTAVMYSANTGIASNGAATTVRIGSSTISNNVTGVAILGGSTMQSFKNNQFSANGFDGPLPLAAVTPNGGGQ